MRHNEDPGAPDQPDGALALELIEHLDALVAYWDANRICRLANSAYRDAFGAHRPSVIGAPLAELLAPPYEADRAHIEAAYTGRKQVFEREMPRRDGGAPGYGLGTCQPHIVDGRVQGVFVLVADVTTMKLVELQLRESEESFRETFDSAPIGMGISTLDGRHVLDVNAALCEFIGYSAQEIKTLSIVDLTHPEDLHLSTEAMRRLLSGAARTYTLEKRYRRKDGRVVWGQATASAVRGANGRARYLIFQVQNIDERRRAAVELQEAKDRLALALAASHLSTWEYDIANGRVRLDGYWATMMGLPAGETLTTDVALAAHTHPEDIRAVYQELLAALKGQSAGGAIEFRYHMADGSWKWIRCTGRVVERDAAGRAVRGIGTNLDITERKSAEEQIRQMAFYDPLTGLPNRQLLDDRMRQMIALARRERSRIGVLFIDLDQFKPINDRCGHAVGDTLLRAAAQRMCQTVRESDTVVRIGGDEFVVLLADIAAAATALEIAEKIRLAMLEPFADGDGDTHAISCSIGVVLYPQHADNLRDLLRLSDQAMYQAKSAGKNAVRLFEPPSSPPAAR